MTILSENIKYLRKGHGETQQMLGDFLCCGKSAISAFESGLREPDEDRIRKIAERYGHTYDEIKYYDLVGIDCSDVVFTYDDIVNCMDIIFPFVVSEQALQDEAFSQAYNNTIKLVKK